MSVWTVSGIANGVTGALRKAANATGAGFDYLLKTAERESSLNPAAKASSSSAAGMFQFVEQTWLQMVKEEGPKHGLGREAAAITKSAGGRYSVADPAARERILNLRHNSEVSALMAGAFTERNSEDMQTAFGRQPSDGELYTAHFLGAQGAIDLVQLASAKPDAKAAAYFPEAASANRSIFYNGGQARGAAEVLQRLTRGQTAPPAMAQPGLASGPAGLFSNATGSAEAAAPATAYAEDRPVFHSMFQTARRAPVSPYVHGIWANLAPSSAAASAPVDLNSFVKSAPAAGSAAGGRP